MRDNQVARCQICDYSTSGPPSLYYESLSLGMHRPAKVFLQQDGKYLCSLCAAKELDKALEEGEVEFEMEADASTVSLREEF